MGWWRGTFKDFNEADVSILLIFLNKILYWISLLYLESPWKLHSNKYKHAWYWFSKSWNRLWIWELVENWKYGNEYYTTLLYGCNLILVVNITVKRSGESIQTIIGISVYDNWTYCEGYPDAWCLMMVRA